MFFLETSALDASNVEEAFTKILDGTNMSLVLQLVIIYHFQNATALSRQSNLKIMLTRRLSLCRVPKLTLPRLRPGRNRPLQNRVVD